MNGKTTWVISMNNIIKEAFISADISEIFAGYRAYLTVSSKDGTLISEEVIPCRTKNDAEEIIEKFLTEDYNGKA